MRLVVIIVVLAATALVAACERASVAPDTISLADRCAAIVERAMPFAEIDIGDKTSKGVDTRTIVARVSGTRTDMAGNNHIERDLVAECTFVDNVLSAF